MAKILDFVKERPAGYTLKPRVFYYGDGAGGRKRIGFAIAPRTDEIVERVRDKSRDPKLPFLTKKGVGFEVVQEANIDGKLFIVNLSRAVLKGWSDFTVASLMALADPSKHEITIDDDAKKDVDLEFSADNLEALLAIASDDFMTWIVGCSTNLQAWHLDEQEKQAKNSQSTSAGS